MGNSFGRNTGNVFRFSCAQMLKKKGFLVSTIVISLLISAAVLAIMAISASSENEEHEPTMTGKLIVCDETDLVCEDGGILNCAGIADAIRESVADCKSVTVEWKDDAKIADEVKAAEAEAGEDDLSTFFAVIKTTEDGYGIYMVRPKNCGWSEGEVTTAGEAMIPLLKEYVEREIDPTMAMFVKMPTSAMTLVVGEDTSIAAMFVKYLLPMISGMLVYFMVMIYGQDIARNVAAEKTSKLMETMLTFVSPNALIFGKILAGFVLSILQVLIWVASGIGGYLVGSAIAKSIDPNYTDRVAQAFNAIRAVTGSSAMTIVPVLLSLTVLFLGLLLFYAIAGIGGSVVTKPEEIGSANAVITFPAMIFWMIGYMAAATQNEAVLTVCRYIPFAAPFTVTAEILVGKVSILNGALIALEMFVCTLIMVWIAGKIYRGLVLYTGEKLSIKKVIGIVRGK